MMTSGDDFDQKVEDENYFVSMTDMMVGLVFIFIILLMYYALQLRETQEIYSTANKELRAADETRAEILENIKKLLHDQGLEVEIDTENGILRLPDQILFDSARADIKPEGVIAIQTLGGVLGSVLPCYTDSSSSVLFSDSCQSATHHIEALFVEGHTDTDPFVGGGGLLTDNWDLSVVRATNTYRKLIELHPQLTLLCLRRGAQQCVPILSVSGYGPERPASMGNDPTSKAKNRRIDLRILMESPRADDVQQKLDSRLGSAP